MTQATQAGRSISVQAKLDKLSDLKQVRFWTDTDGD